MSEGSESRGPDHPINLFLKLEKTATQAKEPVVMHLRVLAHQATDEPVQLDFSSSQKYDFIATRKGREIWRWSGGKLFAMMMSQIVLKPGESLHYTEPWDQRDNEGKLVPPGRYEIVGVLKTSPEVVSEPVAVDIKEG